MPYFHLLFRLYVTDSPYEIRSGYFFKRNPIFRCLDFRSCLYLVIFYVYTMRPFCLVASCTLDAAAICGCALCLPHAHSEPPSSVVQWHWLDSKNPTKFKFFVHVRIFLDRIHNEQNKSNFSSYQSKHFYSLIVVILVSLLKQLASINLY